MSGTEGLSREDLLKLAAAAGASAAVGARFALEPATAAARPERAPRNSCWVLDEDHHLVSCYGCPDHSQTAAKFWETDHPTAFHDAVLARATTRIQGILDSVARKAPKSSPTLSFIGYRGQLFLVWARNVARRPKSATVDASSSFAKVVRTLELDAASREPAARSRIWYADGQGNIFCPVAKPPNCYGLRLWRARKPTPWHTRDLVQATASVQSILDDLKPAGTARELSIITYNYRPLLVWSAPHDRGTTADEGSSKVVKALSLKT